MRAILLLVIRTFYFLVTFFRSRSSSRLLISNIASKVFSAQASQAECERIFSSAGRITTDARNRLNCFHINELSSMSYRACTIG